MALGYAPALYNLVDLKLLQGRCDETFLQSKLTTHEAAVYRQVTPSPNTAHGHHLTPHSATYRCRPRTMTGPPT